MLEEFIPEGRYFLIAYIYTGKEIHSYDFVKSKLVDSFGRLKSKMAK